MRRPDWGLVATIVGCLAVFVLGGAALYVAVRERNAEHDRFMRQCLADRKQYECTTLWRAGREAVDLILVPLPLGR